MCHEYSNCVSFKITSFVILYIVICITNITEITLILYRNLSIPFPSAREAEIVYQVLRVDKEPSRGSVTKNLTLDNNLLQVLISGTEARKIRVALTSFFDSLILVTETMQQFGPSESIYNYY
ncbi:EKC/KEOPS complex subunit LAGE3 [Anthophora quadrimaculata]